MNTVSEFQPLSLMLSSRCQDQVMFNGKKVAMSTVRSEIKEAIKSIQQGGLSLFDVWIHEDESQTAADENTWDSCMRRARQSDIVLILYNGNSGWSGSSKLVRDKVGICHAEFSEAYNKAPGKVRSVQFPAIKAKQGSPDDDFQDYFISQNVPGTQVTTGEEAIEAAQKLAVAAVLSLARAGVGVNAKGSYFAGEALKWTRLDFQKRREVTRLAVAEYLSARAGDELTAEPSPLVTLPIAGQKVAILCDCIPATLSTAGARELVGQPFLRDHLLVGELPGDIAGPLHVIACQKGVTESQALRQLGFPDAIVVTAPFGVYVADDVQKIQMVFIAQCRDETTTRQGTQRFLQWLEEQGEDVLLAKRAVSRRKIANMILDVS